MQCNLSLSLFCQQFRRKRIFLFCLEFLILLQQSTSVDEEINSGEQGSEDFKTSALS